MMTVFFVVLVAGAVSKATTFFMVSQVRASQRSGPVCGQIPGLVLPVNSSLSLAPAPGEKVAWLWTIFFAFAIPEVFTLLRALKAILSGCCIKPGIKVFISVFLIESLHVLGLSLLFFAAFPGWDSVHGLVVTSGVATIPGVLRVFMTQTLETRKSLYFFLCALAIMAQISSLVVWPTLNHKTEIIWALPLGLLLTSLGWWECYVEENGTFSPLWDIKTLLTDGGGRGFTDFFLSLWKIVFFLICMAIICPLMELLPDYWVLFETFTESFETNQWIIHLTYGDQETVIVQTDYLERSEKLTKSPALALLIQSFCSLVTYLAGTFACKFNIQISGFALPLSLVTPLTLTFVIPFCHFRNEEPCKYSSLFPKYLFYHCPSNMDSDWTWLLDNWLFMWFPLLFSHLWITIQVWYPKNKRLLDIPHIFGKDLYSSLLIDVSMMLNRRKDNGERSRKFDNKIKHFSQMKFFSDNEIGTGRSNKQLLGKKLSTSKIDYCAGISPEDLVTRVKGCATMWHETREEMEEIIKSLFRIDDDYHARKLALQLYDRDEDFYEWEAHIFFDDAMTRSKDDPEQSVINPFVQTLINTIGSLGLTWYGSRGFQIEMTRTTTPYGGRLEWTLPGTTKITCHLKNKNKIRHKKR